MDGRFDYFVVFAAMRTGSNFLEENLNDYPGLHCYGEAFNPHFVGHAGKTEMLGVTMAARETDPGALLTRMQAETDGLPGFRFFHDHDPRILQRCLPEPRCAKVILTRNPVDSYVSTKIARATGQWRLGDMKKAKSAAITFDAAEFERYLDELQAFQLELLRALQTTGQTAYWLAYDDIRDVEVLNGLATWLGVDATKKRTSQATKVQNPAPLETKVTNFEEMQAALGLIDRFDLTRTPNFEPRRAAAVPHYTAAAEAPLLYLPVPGGPEARVRAWLAALDGVEEAALQAGFNQKTLRQWKRQQKGHRSFSVVRHPVARLHEAFVTRILPLGPDSYGDVRRTLRESYKLPIPEGAPGADYTVKAHRKAFLAFVRFVQGNLGGQTSLRVDGAWASQSEVLQGMAKVQVPDVVIREDRLAEGLDWLAREIGRDPAPVPTEAEVGAHPLEAIYDEEIEAAVRAAYQRDYMMFGFRAWG